MVGEYGFKYKDGAVESLSIYHLYEFEKVTQVEGTPLAPEIYKRHKRDKFKLYDDFTREEIVWI